MTDIEEIDELSLPNDAFAPGALLGMRRSTGDHAPLQAFCVLNAPEPPFWTGSLGSLWRSKLHPNW